MCTASPHKSDPILYNFDPKGTSLPDTADCKSVHCGKQSYYILLMQIKS